MPAGMEGTEQWGEANGAGLPPCTALLPGDGDSDGAGGKALGPKWGGRSGWASGGGSGPGPGPSPEAAGQGGEAGLALKGWGGGESGPGPEVAGERRGVGPALKGWGQTQASVPACPPPVILDRQFASYFYKCLQIVQWAPFRCFKKKS